MDRQLRPIRRLVRRPGADQSLLITLLSFALTVSLTRLFLHLTGNPQLGGGDLHIAHMLWGGLALFIAALLLLIYINRWVYRLGAVLAGVGVGLFIDEVGKFITQSNDYFYAPAAPIIYAFFLICVLVYFQVRRPPARQARTELYTALEITKEVLDRDLDSSERAEVETRLRYVAGQKDQPELARLAKELLDYVKSKQIEIAPTPPDRLIKLKEILLVFESRYINQVRLRTSLAVGLGVLGLVSTINSIQLLLSNIKLDPLERAFILEIAGRGNASYATNNWFFLNLVVQGIPGALLVAGAMLLVTGRERGGLHLSYFALLAYLTIADLLTFYYSQFSTIILATIQLVLLLVVLYYRRRYLSQED